MKTIILTLITFLMIIGCNNSYDEITTIEPFNISSSIEILKNSFDGSGVNISYSLNNTGDVDINYHNIIFQVNTLVLDYEVSIDTNIAITIGEAITNTIFINTESNNYTNFRYAYKYSE